MQHENPMNTTHKKFDKYYKGSIQIEGGRIEYSVNNAGTSRYLGKKQSVNFTNIEM